MTTIRARGSPAPCRARLKKLAAAEVVKEESEKAPHGQEGARLLHEVPGARGPWDRVAEGAYHQFVAV
jgi:hypothetical protein